MKKFLLKKQRKGNVLLNFLHSSQRKKKLKFQGKFKP